MPNEAAATPQAVERAPKAPGVKRAEVKKPVGQIEQDLANKIPPKLGKADPSAVNPDLILQSLLTDTQTEARKPFLPQAGESNVPQQESRETSIVDELAKSERQYIANSGMKGLEERYNHESTNANYVGRQIEEYAAKAGLQHERGEEFSGRAFDIETRTLIKEKVQGRIDRLLLSEQGRINPEKHRLVTEQTQRYLDLIQQAQAEGDIQKDMDAQVVMCLVEENVWKLAYQDRVASENMLGDHGIRHIVGFNIAVTEKLGDELVRNGQEMRAADRLIMHQTMINHDLGYSMDTVRQPIAEGAFGADSGHNLLSAKVIRERMSNTNDIINKVFSQDQMAIIHEGVLYHDTKPSRFIIGDASMEARKNNIQSAIHTADNTHAFENKLPELLYGYPGSLRTLRLIQAAGEIGDTGMLDNLKLQLIADIQANEAFTQDDREGLINAARFLSANSYEKTVPRIAGNNPEFSIDASGAVSVTVSDSEVHRQTARHFGQEDINIQIKKFVGDVAGVKSDVRFDEQTEVASADGSVVIKLRDIQLEGEKSDYQQRVEQVFDDPRFRDYLEGKPGEIGDSQLARRQRQAQSMLKQMQEGSEEHQQLTAELEVIKSDRKQLLQSYTEDV